jgi:hypothetical protein
MQQNVRYYIVKADDQPVVRSVPVTRQHAAVGVASDDAKLRAGVEGRKPSVSSVLRLALRRKNGTDEGV